MIRQRLHTFTSIAVGVIPLHAAFSFVNARLDIPYPSFQVARSVELASNELQRLPIRHNSSYYQAYVECQAALDHYWDLQGPTLSNLGSAIPSPGHSNGQE